MYSRSHVAGLVLGVLCIGPQHASARVAFSIPPTLANEHTTSDQFASGISAVSPNEFVVVWTSLLQDGVQGGAAGVFGRRIDSFGAPTGGEFQVNTYTPYSQFYPSVASHGDGEFVVSWLSYSQDGDAEGVFAQRFDGVDAKRGTEFQVNSFTTAQQFNAEVARAPDGSSIVVWNSLTPQSSGAEVFAARFNEDGIPLGSEFQVNTYTTETQLSPTAAYDVDGNLLVVWFSGRGFDEPEMPDGSGPGIFGRAFGPDGTPYGDDFLINSYTTHGQVYPSVGRLPHGGFVVTWGGAGPTTTGYTNYGVFGRVVAGGGTPTDGQFFIGESNVIGAGHVSVAISDAGIACVAWEKTEFEDPVSVAAQVFLPSGTLIGGPFTADLSAAAFGTDPHITALGGDRFALTWTGVPTDVGDADGLGVLYRTFTAAPECGDAIVSGAVTSTDALAALQAAVSLFACPLCVCDVDRSGAISSTDALVLLRYSVGTLVSLSCEDCG